MRHKGPRRGRRPTIPQDSPYAGGVTCLRCDRAFWSWDRRQNRLCPACHQTLEQEPSDEPALPFRPPRRRWAHHDEG
jgi:hypothetical protein